MIQVRPDRGGNHHALGCGLFAKYFLLGKGPEGARVINPSRGATQSDINYEYKEASARAAAREHTEKIISRLVISGVDVSEEQAENIRQRELMKISRKFTHMRYHSFLVYFGVLKRLHWVEATGEIEPSSIQDNYAAAPDRIYYRITQEGKEASDDLWANPLFALYPDIGRNHRRVQIT